MEGSNSGPSQQNEKTRSNWICSKQNYSADGAKNSFHGYAYQLKLLLLCLKRGLDKKYPFHFATEMKDAETFDDLVFFYEIDGRIVYRFVQAKHRRKENALITSKYLLNKTKGDFSLKKYLKSFSSISQNQLFSDNEKKTSKEFIICTNADFNYKDLEKNGIQLEELRDDDFMFKEENGKRYKLNIPNKDHEIFKVCSDVYCLAQMLATCLFEKKLLNLSENMFKEYYEALAREVLQVKIERQIGDAKFREDFLNCSASLSEEAKVFRSVFQEVFIEISGESDEEKIREQFENAKLQITVDFGKMTTKSRVKLPNDIKATNDAMHSFLNHLVFAVNQPNDDQLERIISEEIGKELNLVDSDLTVGFIEKEIMSWFYKKVNEKGREGVFLTQEDGKALFEMAKKKSQKLELLGPSAIYRKEVEDFKLEFQTGKGNTSKLKTFLETQTKKVFIFVSQQLKLSSAKVLHVLQNNEQFQLKENFFISASCLRTLNDQLLRNLKSSTKSLFVIELEECSDIKLIQQVFDVVHEGQNQLILISPELHQLNGYLENSLLTFKQVIDKDFFKELSHESQSRVLEKKVIFQGKEVRLKDLINTPLEESNSQAKEIICDDTLYKLVTNIAVLIGEELKKIENYVDRTFSLKDNTSIVQPQTAFNVADQFVVVAAEPGMGKSSFLTQLAHQTKERFPSSWVVRVNLNDQTKLLKEMDFKKCDIRLVVQFLEHVLNLRDPGEKLLFEEAFDSNGNIVVLVDAFDEISPNYKENVIALLQTLKETQIKRTWVMTRTHLKEELEKTFNVRAYVIEPFSEEMQKDFLKNNLPHFDGWHIQSLIQSMKNLSRSSRSTEELTSSPLYLKMVVEVFKGEQNADTDIDILSLYEKFIDFKFREYKAKMNVDFSEASLSEEFERSFKRLLKYHKMAALYALFDEFEIAKLLTKHERVKAKRYFDEEVKEAKERVGIVTGMADERKPVFVHRTFAEYLTALWFSECVQDGERVEVIRPFLKERLYERDFKVIRELFDRILAKGFPLHTAFINGRVIQNDSSMSDEEIKTECKKFDRCGRSPLHLFMFYSEDGDKCYYDTIKFLVNHCGDVKVKEKVLEWSPFSFYLRRLRVDDNWSIEKRVQWLLLGDETELSRDEVVNELKHLGNSVFEESLTGFYRSLNEKCPEHCYWLFNSFMHESHTFKPWSFGWRGLKLYFKHDSTTMSKLKVINFLIKKGVDVNFIDRHGKTVIDYAAHNGDYWSVRKYLIYEKGADIELSDLSRHDGLIRAVQNNRLYIVKYMIERKIVRVDIGELRNEIAIEVAKNGSVDLMKCLHSKGVDFLVTDIWGRSPLHEAVEYGKFEAVKCLVEQMNADLQLQDDYGDTPLMCATEYIDIFKYLVEKGSNVNTTNKYGQNVLHRAAYLGHLDVLKYVIEVLGLDLKDSKPLKYAMEGYLSYNRDVRFEVIQYLLEKGQYDTINKRLWFQRLNESISERDRLNLIIALADELEVEILPIY